jgi:hypothetical protein
VLQDFADVGTRIALPTSAQLDGRCLKNCFQSSHLTRDISMSQASLPQFCSYLAYCGGQSAFFARFLMSSFH